jgi:hypothetical protein
MAVGRRRRKEEDGMGLAHYNGRGGRLLRTWLPVLLGIGVAILVDVLADALVGRAAGYRLSLFGGALDVHFALAGGCLIGLVGGALLALLALARWQSRALRTRLDAYMERELPALTFALPSFSLLVKVHLLGLGFRLTERLSCLWRTGPGRPAEGVAAGGAALNAFEPLRHALVAPHLAIPFHAYRWTNLTVADLALVAGLTAVLLLQRHSVSPDPAPRRAAR